MDTQEIQKLMQRLTPPVAASTQIEYDRALHRLGGTHWRDYASHHLLGKRAASVLRAAWRRGMAFQIKDELNTLRLLAMVSDSESVAYFQRVVQPLLDKLTKDQALPAYQPPTGIPRAGRNSKRKSLRGLPPDWRDQLIENAKPDDQLPLLVMALCGCRPAELKKGVGVMSDPPLLAFIIHGAKIKDHAGYEQRAVAIDPHTLLFRNHDLIQLLFATSQTVAIGDDQSFQKRVKRFAVRLGFKNVSCYSLRHQLAADAKATGTGKTELARVLGHQAERTQRYYGNHQQGNKGGRVLEIHGHTQQDPRPAPDVRPVWNARAQWIEQKKTKVRPSPDHRPE